MYPSKFIPADDFVFVEIFAIPVPGSHGPVSVQRRFDVTKKWRGCMNELPVAPDRNHCGTSFVPAEVAYMLYQSGVLEVPNAASYCVQYACRGYYCDTARNALAYVNKRWPRELAIFSEDLRSGVPMELSPDRQRAFDENRERLQPWLDKAEEQRAQFAKIAAAAAAESQSG